jgi:hypothetical protein
LVGLNVKNSFGLFPNNDGGGATHHAVEGHEVFAYEDRWHAHGLFCGNEASARTTQMPATPVWSLKATGGSDFVISLSSGGTVESTTPENVPNLVR